MYVQCERCKTEYDFDDALVSERGTTVKCTQCGHQFKVRRGAGTVVEAGSDRWVVTTVSGKTLVFTSLRELQKAILGKQVARGDSLARGSGPPRILGGIAELEPFFDGKRTSMAAASEVQPQAGTQRSSSRPPPPPGNESHPLEPPKRGRIDTLRPPMEHGTAMPPPAAAQERVSPFAKTASPASAALAGTLPHMQAPGVPSRTPPPPFVVAVPPPEPTIPTPPPQMAPPPEVPTMPAVQVDARPQSYMPEMSSPIPPPATRASRPPQDSYLDPRPSLADEFAVPPRRPMGGWIVAAVLFLGVCVLGFFVAKPYLLSGTPKPAASSLAPLDPKAQKLLDDGERAYSDGDLDGAKENFDKASMLADKDPRVMLDIARVANARADVAWLKVRLLPPDSGEPLALAKKDLDDLAVKAKAAAEASLASAPDDPAAMRAKMDALRITGDLPGARALVLPTSSIAAQPESAYVLAALDLAEPTVPTAQVLSRLRDAADAERNLGRARGALVYALARSGDPGAARREIERLLALPKPYALLAPLRAFVDRAPAPTGDAGPVAVMNVNALPTGAAVGTGGGASNDPRVLLQQADTARQHGDLDKAKTLYGKALELNPSDSEALAGLGQVAHAQHDMANAQTYYRRAMAANGTYLPAMVGLADVLWDSGDKPGAVKIYKDVEDRFPEAAYASYVKQRAEGGGGGGATPAPTSSDPAP